MSLKTTFMKKLAAKAKNYFSLGAQREGWLALVRWTQNKRGLWALGEVKAPTLDYLGNHYASTVSGNRRPLAEHLLPSELINGTFQPLRFNHAIHR